MFLVKIYNMYLFLSKAKGTFRARIKYMNETSPTRPISLTRREKEILSHIAEGLSSKQIAWRLDIAERTVVNHRCNMLRKTGTKSSSELLYRHKKYFE